MGKVRELINTIIIEKDYQSGFIISALKDIGYDLDIEQIPISQYDCKTIIKLYRNTEEEKENEK